jgi:hypothetical protein
MVLLLGSDNGWSAISPENRDPLFRIALKTWSLKKALGAKKEARPKGPGITLLVAAQYIQKSPKNNGLLRGFGPRSDDFFAGNQRNRPDFAGYSAN